MSAKDKTRETVAARLREARVMAGLSQAQAARILKVHRPSVSEIEAGRRRVSADELRMLCDAYDVSPEWVLGTAPEILDTSDPRVALAARDLAKIKPKDLERLIKMLAALKKDRGGAD